MPRTLLIAVLAAAALTVPSRAQQSEAEYPYVVEEKVTRWEMSVDGTATSTTRVRFRIATAGGIRMLGQILEPYVVGQSLLEVLNLTVRHADGSVDELRPEDVRDLPAPVTAAYPVYSDLHILHITPPGLRTGDVVELELQRQIVRPDAPGYFWVEHNFVRDTVVGSEVLEVLVPAASAVKLRTADGLDSETTLIGDRRRYRWTHSLTEVEPEEEQAFDPRALVERPQIELSSFPDWQSVGTWYADLALARSRPNQAIRRKAEELTEGLEVDRERIAALYDYVRRDVRYLGLMFGLGRYQPHGAAETLANGYGDCKDKHTLLAALLRAAGYEAWPVAVAVMRRPTPEVPGPAQFDHLITAVHTEDGTLWLDSTESVNPFGYLSPALRGKQGLLVKGDGQSRLVELPETLPYPAFEATRVEGRVDRDGTLAGTVTIGERSDAEPMMRAAFLNSTGEQHRQIGEQALSLLGLDAELEEITTTAPADTREPFEVTIAIRKADFVSPFSASQEVQLPDLPVSFAALVEEDEDDLFLGNPAKYTLELDLSFPDGVRLEPPLSIDVEREFATLSSAFEGSDGRLIGSRTLRMTAVELTADQRDAYDAFVDTAQSDNEQSLGLTFADGALADAGTIEDADRLYRAGEDAHGRDDFKTAVTLFERAVELEPEHEDAWDELGHNLIHAERYEDAIAAIRRQLEVTPHHSSAHSRLGWALEEAGDMDAAADAFRKQLQIDPSDEYATERLGIVLWSVRRYEESLPYLRRAARSDPEDEALTWRLADSELHVGGDESGDSLRRVLEETEDLDELGQALSVLAQHGHEDQVEPLLGLLQQESRDPSELWMLRGEMARAAERDEEAREAYARALDLDPDNSLARIELAAALYRLQRYEDAIPHYRQYLEEHPDDVDNRFWLAQALLMTGEGSSATAELEAVVDAQPENYAAWSALAMVRLQLDDTSGAAQAVDRASELAPDDPATRFWLAKLYSSTGRPEKAKALVLSIRDEDGTGNLPCGQSAGMLFALEAYDEAEARARACVDADPQDGWAHNQLGVSYARRGAYEEARPHLDRAAELLAGEFADQEMLDYVRRQIADSD